MTDEEIESLAQNSLDWVMELEDPAQLTKALTILFNDVRRRTLSTASKAAFIAANAIADGRPIIEVADIPKPSAP